MAGPIRFFAVVMMNMVVDCVVVARLQNLSITTVDEYPSCGGVVNITGGHAVICAAANDN